MKLNWEEISETLFDYHCSGWFISPQIFPGRCTRRKPTTRVGKPAGGASTVTGWDWRQEGTRGSEERTSQLSAEGSAVMPTRSWGPNLCSGSFCSIPICCQGRSSSLGRARSWNPNTRPQLFHMSRRSASVSSPHTGLSHHFAQRGHFLYLGSFSSFTVFTPICVSLFLQYKSY